MKKTFFKKMISAGIIMASLSTVAPLGVSAQEKAVSSTWRQSSDKTWSYYEGNTAVKGWKKISNVWYNFDNNGKMKTGWIKDAGKWYYADSTGAMQTGVIKIAGKIYYFNNQGQMQTGSITIGGKTYTFSVNGQIVGNKKPNCEQEFDSNNNVVKPGNGSNNNSSSDNNSQNNNTNNNVETKPENNNNSQGSNNAAGNNSSSNKDDSITVSGLPDISKKYSVTVQDSAESKILELMNAKRTEAGLQPLSLDTTLQSVARYKSDHMIQNGYFSHTNPDGTQWSNWLQKIGYKYNTTAENIAYNTNDPVELFNQWWNSSGHRENMMNPSYTKVGIGVLYGNGKYMGTQTFAG